jgi:hypothetical protein
MADYMRRLLAYYIFYIFLDLKCAKKQNFFDLLIKMFNALICLISYNYIHCFIDFQFLLVI